MLFPNDSSKMVAGLLFISAIVNNLFFKTFVDENNISNFTSR